MFSTLSFYYKKLLIYIHILFKGIINQKWKAVEGVNLPFKKELGFNTLRWIANGQYEQDEIRIIKSKLVKGDRVMEIGTGLGFVATYCSKITGSENVFTFEANPINYETAKIVFNKNAVSPTLCNALLSDTDGVVQFPVDIKSRLASSLLNESGKLVTVKKLILNDEIQKIDPHFLLMDIEGGEYDIFKQIQFQNIMKIQFELHPKILGKEKCDEIFSILSKNGFQKNDSVSANDNFFYFKNSIP